MGKVAAGNIAAFCRMSFPKSDLALVVGVCGGAPLFKVAQILLGDVIISTGVIQYDLGRRFADKFEMKDTLSESLGRPSLEVRSLLSKLRTARQHGRLQVVARSYLDQIVRDVTGTLSDRKRSLDVLFPADYRHKHQDPSACAICAICNERTDPVCEMASKLTCEDLGCDLAQRLPRARLATTEKDQDEIHEQNVDLTVHFGTFASGDTVMKSGLDRDQLTVNNNAIGFEMESVGVWDVFPCVVIKGVCDYADSHKNKDWQGYAAASAAACTKAFLAHWDSMAQ
jgi:nucleoside phosphorylase